MQKEPTILEVMQNSLGERGALVEWINRNKREGTWGGFSVAVFLSYMLRINIIIVSNFTQGFVHQSTYELLQHEHTTNTPTMHSHHHLCNRPTVPSNECNHFALLKPEPNVDNSMSRQVYSGGTNAEVNKKFYDLSHGNNINIKDNTINKCEKNVNGGNSNKARVMKKIRNNEKSKDCTKNDHFYTKPTKRVSAMNTKDPFSDSDAETDVESMSKCNENKKDKKKNITKYFPRKANKASKCTYKQPKRMASKKFQKLSKEQKKEERRR